jgi:hypothetical protein
MTCLHLKRLYEVCRTNGLRMSSSDLIHIVCPECGVKEVCPSVYSIEYDAESGDADGESPGSDAESND